MDKLEKNIKTASYGGRLHYRLCLCLCVHHINRSGPNLKIIHLEKTKCGCRSGPWSAGQRREKGKQKEPPRGTNCKNECENNYYPRKPNQKYLIQWKKTKQTQTKKQKSKGDDNRHERTRTLNRGVGRKVVLAMERDAQWRSNYSTYRRKGQTESKTSFNMSTSGDSCY